jgi:hypothetical protein
MKRGFALLAVLGLACTSHEDPGGAMPCGPNGECSPGYACSSEDHVCFQTAADGAPVDVRPDAAPDAPSPDARTPDATVPDARTPDATVPDARTPDAAVPDARTPDATVPDASPDAPPPDADTTGPTVIVDQVMMRGGTAIVDQHSPDPDMRNEYCAIDDGPFTDCTGKNPVYMELAPGVHTFHAYAVDTSGNQGPMAAAQLDAVVGDGHIVLIGDELDDAAAPVERLVANAVELAHASTYTRAIRVIGWVNPNGTVDPTQHDTTLAALDDGIAAGGLHAAAHQGDFSDTSQLAAALAGNDVLLVYNQSNAGQYLWDVGAMWEPVLADFLAHGGVILVLDGYAPPVVDTSNPVGESWRVLGSLLPVTASQLVPPRSPGATTVSGTDPVGTGVSSYALPDFYTVVYSFQTPPAGYTDVVDFDYSYQHMVIHVELAN